MTKIDNALRTVSAEPTQQEWADFLLARQWADTPETGSYIALPSKNEAPIALDVPTLPDTDQDGRAMLAIAAGAIIGGCVVVALYAWGWLL